MQEIVSSPDLEDMGAVVKLDERMVVVGLADNVELAVTEDGIKVVRPDERYRLKRWQ